MYQRNFWEGGLVFQFQVEKKKKTKLFKNSSVMVNQQKEDEENVSVVEQKGLKI